VLRKHSAISYQLSAISATRTLREQHWNKISKHWNNAELPQARRSHIVAKRARVAKGQGQSLCHKADGCSRSVSF